MKGIKHECQLMERCDGHDHGGSCQGVWEGGQLSGIATVLSEV